MCLLCLNYNIIYQPLLESGGVNLKNMRHLKIQWVTQKLPSLLIVVCALEICLFIIWKSNNNLTVEASSAVVNAHLKLKFKCALILAK